MPKTFFDFLRKTARRGCLVMFIPWATFYGQSGGNLFDGGKLVVGIADRLESCSSPRNTYKVALAVTAERHEKGLSGRSRLLKPDEGMLFLFDPPAGANFWMKKTLIPLDLLYFNAKGVLTEMHHMPVEQDPATPKKTYPSASAVAVALEVAPGAVVHLKKGAILCVKKI